MNKQDLLARYRRNLPAKWKQRGFTVLPHALLFNEHISKSTLLVFWVLTAHMFRGKKYAFPSLTTLEEETRSSRHTVIKAIRELKDNGYLEVEGNKNSGKVNKYYLKVRL